MVIPHLPDPLVRAVRALVGAAFGTVTALTGLCALVVDRRTRLRRHARRDRRRLVQWFGATSASDLPDRDPRRYVLARCGYGIVGGILLVTALTSAMGYLGWTVELTIRSRIPIHTSAVTMAVSAVGLYLCARFAVALGRWDVALALRFLGDDMTQRRLRELERTRADVVRAVDDERRRIERALHDGVQQRAVAVALQLGRARRRATGERAELGTELDRAVAEAGQLIRDLREVAWRIYPSVLDEQGLEVALRGLSAHTTMPLRLHIDLDRRPPTAIAAAAYFVIAEAVTNAVKHSGAHNVSVSVTASPDRITAEVRDDGSGGADPAGAGLTGLRRRVAALDGTLRVRSPIGGPTILTAELPCAS
ncbi:histidine kinase [Nocardia sp. NPDC050793]|uniref:sensor histidine kinase n=1 Tax=Nocardia sp. NPDC050793 TaxID=3155159 RepID=UPI0033FEFBB2